MGNYTLDLESNRKHQKKNKCLLKASVGLGFSTQQSNPNAKICAIYPNKLAQSYKGRM